MARENINPQIKNIIFTRLIMIPIFEKIILVCAIYIIFEDPDMVLNISTLDESMIISPNTSIDNSTDNPRNNKNKRLSHK